jgi:hypothetical protein
MATKKLLLSFGDGGTDSAAGAGNEGAFEDVGVGLVSLPLEAEATGKDRLSRFGLRGVYDCARVCLAAGLGTCAMGNCGSLLRDGVEGAVA